MRSRTIRKRRLHAIWATPGNKRFLLQYLLETRGYYCQNCRHPVSVLSEPAPYRATLDHIKPRSKGGGDHRDNLQILCSFCNSHKGSMDDTEFKALGLRMDPERSKSFARRQKRLKKSRSRR